MSTLGNVLGSVGPLEVVIVLIIALVVLGPKRLPEVGKSVGRGLREFKAAVGGGGGGDTVSARLDRLGGDEDNDEQDLFAEERQAEERRRFEEQQTADETAARERF